MKPAALELRPILDEDADAVARFLHRELARSVSVEQWRTILLPPWPQDAPNHGFQLVGESGIVGAYVAVYSTRRIGGTPVQICNLAAFCVLEEFRAHSLRLVRAILGQRGFEFTDLSPSGNVIELNRRLGFRSLDTTTKIVVNVPALRHRGIRVTGDRRRIEHSLTGSEAAVFQDHQPPASARHILVTAGDEMAYLIVRKDRRRGLPLFASIVHVGGSAPLVRRAWGQIRSHLLMTLGAPFTLAERRVIGFDPPSGWSMKHPRPKMFRSERLHDDQIDYAYSELALIEW